MYAETLATGHRAIWSLPEHLHHQLVLIFTTPAPPRDRRRTLLDQLPPGTTGRPCKPINPPSVSTGLRAKTTTTQTSQKSAPTESLMPSMTTNTAPPLHQHSSAGVGQALPWPPHVRVRPEAINGVVGLNGYIIDNPLLAALIHQRMMSPPARFVITIGDTRPPLRGIYQELLTTHTQSVEAKQPRPSQCFYRRMS